MTRIIHLSDPHFGTVPPDLPDALAATLATLGPDAVILSGDLTQRARPAQFAAARRFMQSCPAPLLAIPGNHDIPLFNLPLRLMAPWRNWSRSLSLPLEGEISTDRALIAGINTANPHVWKDGLIRPAQLERLSALFARAGDRRRIVALHHPPEPPNGEAPSLSGAAQAVAAFARMGVDMLLSGHLHFTHIAPLTAAPSILSVQAGTCLSTRTRNDGNAFSMIDLTDGGATITHYRASTDGSFKPDAATAWARTPEGWR
ncbi:MAG: phosphodiesterase [Rhodobacter sp.]|nr:phosphodiesterase [Rhodobacter sp.]